MDGKPTTIAMTEAEVALYHSGTRRGHSECLQQISGQLRDAAKQHEQYANDGCTYSAQDVANSFDKIAQQLDEPASQAQKEQQRLLDRWCAIRSISERTLFDKAKAAINGALAGWRGR